MYNHHFLGWNRANHDLHVAQENQDGSDLANRDAYMWLSVFVRIVFDCVFDFIRIEDS